MDVLIVKVPVKENVKLLVQEAVVVTAVKEIAGVVAKEHVIAHALEAVGITIVFTNNDPNKRKPRLLAVRHGEEHHLHRHEGLPVGLQILLSCGQKREGADALGCRQNFY